jgi:hypothetical protein
MSDGWRGVHPADDLEYAWIVELGGFLVSGPCTVGEVILRFGRATACLLMASTRQGFAGKYSSRIWKTESAKT